MSALSQRERKEIGRANQSARPPVVFVHGLWMLAGSWSVWRQRFEEHGYITLAPGWPDDPDTVEEGRAHPEVFAGKGIQQVADHFEDVIRALGSPPAIVGHSFGGLIAQILAGRGLGAVTVAIDPAPFRGVLPLPLSALKGAFPVLRSPANYRGAVMLTFEEFRFAFANALDEAEARALYQAHAVPCSGRPLFQAATANLNPWTEAKVDSTNPERGPLLILSGERDNLVPWSMAHAAYERQKRNRAVTEFRELAGRGHSLTIDSGWREVADTALLFIERHHPPLERARAFEEEARPEPH